MYLKLELDYAYLLNLIMLPMPSKVDIGLVYNCLCDLLFLQQLSESDDHEITLYSPGIFVVTLAIDHIQELVNIIEVLKVCYAKTNSRALPAAWLKSGWLHLGKHKLCFVHTYHVVSCSHSAFMFSKHVWENSKTDSVDF